MRLYLLGVAVTVALFVGTTRGYSQHWSIGGNMGFSYLAGSPGFNMTPMAELLFNRNIGLGSEFSINTQYGAPLIWHPYFKYYFDVRGSGLRPFASAGPLLAFNVSDSPCFGFLFGGGINIPLADRLYLGPNAVIGPVFGFGGGKYPFILRGHYWGFDTYGLTTFTIPGITVIAFSVRGGIRYEI